MFQETSLHVLCFFSLNDFTLVIVDIFVSAGNNFILDIAEIFDNAGMINTAGKSFDR